MNYFLKQILITYYTINHFFLKFFGRINRRAYFEYLRRKGLKCSNNPFIGKNIRIIGCENISIGEKSSIDNNCIIECHNKYLNKTFNPKITIGNNFSMGEYCHITCINSISIGNGVLFGRFVLITDNSHGSPNDKSELGKMPKMKDLATKGAIEIGNNVWIGDKVTILANVKIGDNSIIGAGSVVTHDFPENSIIGGIPAKQLR